jgi:hypothetical protein
MDHGRPWKPGILSVRNTLGVSLAGVALSACGVIGGESDRQTPLEASCAGLFEGSKPVMDAAGALMFQYAVVGEELPFSSDLSPIDQLDPNPHKKIKKLTPENERVRERLHPYDYEHAAGEKVPASVATLVRDIEDNLEAITLVNTADGLATPLERATDAINQLRRTCGLEELD